MGKSRVGYKLTEDAELMVSRHEGGSCHCRTSPPPCSWCTDTCSVEDAEDIDEYWEIDPDYEEEEMTEPYLFKKGDIVERINGNFSGIREGSHYKVAEDQKPHSERLWIINDLGQKDDWSAENFKLVEKAEVPAPPPPKSPWFGYKYQVNPETSKLLQEAVFKDGGSWSHSPQTEVKLLDSVYLFVDKNGGLSHQGSDKPYFDKQPLPEKQPPQPAPYKFKVGDKVRVTKNLTGHNYKVGDVTYLVGKPHVDGQWGTNHLKGVTFCANGCWIKQDEFELVQSEVDKEDKKEDNGCTVELATHKHQGNTTTTTIVKGRPIGQNNLYPEVIREDAIWEFTKIEDLLTKQEDTPMTQLTTRLRRVLSIQLLDNDAGLPVEHSLVAKFEEVVTEDTDEVTIQELISTGEVAKHIEAHNKVRTEQINLEIQNRTGNTVKLLPIKLKNLTWNIK